MNIDTVRKIELEITSNCNAACPGCARTQNKDLLEINSFGLLKKTKFKTEGHVGRRARLFEFNQKKYEELEINGFIFDI
jgi:hypothetical protein